MRRHAIERRQSLSCHHLSWLPVLDAAGPRAGRRVPHIRDFVAVYAWMNVDSSTGGKVTLVIENPWGVTNPSVSDHIKADRDYYDAVSNQAQTSPTSPFNGTTGMGFGTLANRPSTCTTSSLEPGGGVGYWATDTNFCIAALQQTLGPFTTNRTRIRILCRAGRWRDFACAPEP